MTGFRIAIDGPAGSGKSTVAKRVAEQLGFMYIDTGAMYRSIAWKALQEVESPDQITGELLTEIASKTILHVERDFEGKNHFYVDGQEVTEDIRSPLVSRTVSKVAANKEVREALVAQQRKLGAIFQVVMDGRDIGTQVFPHAEVKVFLNASVDERARRRWKEFSEKGENISLEELKSEIEERDRMDREREHSPLMPAKDAIHIDTTSMSIEEVIQKIISIYEEKKQ